MKAAVVNTDLALPPVSVREMPVPDTPPHWALVRLHHSGLNRLDSMQLEMRSEEAPGSVYGSDGAGVIAKLGAAVEPRAGLSVGDPVLISPSIGWGALPQAPGEDYQILGSPTNGTHAEYVVVPAANLYPKPAHLTFPEAAALPMAGVTAWRALLTRGRLQAGETVVIGAASSASVPSASRSRPRSVHASSPSPLRLTRPTLR